MSFFPLADNPLPDAVKWPTRIFWGGLILILFGIMLHPLVDPDVFIHLRDGKHWVESGFQVDKDPFNYTVENKPFEKVEWLFRIGIYLTWKIGGYSLLIIIKAIIVTLAFLLFGGLIYRRWPNMGLVGFMLGLSILALWTRIAPERPQIFTYLCLPWVIHLLEDYRSAPHAFLSSQAKKLWLIPLAVIPWANLHPGFIIIIAFLGAQSLDYAWTYIRQRELHALHQFALICLLLVSVIAAGCINPIGLGIYHFVLQALSNSNFMQTIVEWMPPEFQRKPVFFLLLAFTWVIQLFSFRRTRLSDFLLLVFFSYLALKSRRNIPFFLLAAMPALAGHLLYLRKLWFAKLAFTFNHRRTGLIAGNIFLAAILVTTVTTGYAFRLGRLPDYYPTQGLEWIQKQKLQGRIFNPLHWSGYIGWKTQGRIKTFMDGRLPTFAGELFTDYSYIIYGHASHCLPTLDKYNIQILLVSPKNYFALFQQLVVSGKWALVYWDHVSQVFVRREGPNQEVSDKHAYLAVDPNATPYSHPAQHKQALREIERAQKEAPDSFLPLFFKGDILLQQDNLDAARICLEQVYALRPKHSHTCYDLGIIAMRADRQSDAEKYFTAALRNNVNPSFQAKVYYSLAAMLKGDPLRRRKSLYYAQKALRILPNWPPAIQLLQELENR